MGNEMAGMQMKMNGRRRWAARAMAAALCLCAAPAWGGTVTTKAGTVYSGAISFVAGDKVNVAVAGDAPVTVALADVAKLSMRDAPAVAASGPAAAGAVLPSPWQAGDMGTVSKAGSAAEKDGVFTMTASGWGIWGAADSGQFIHQTMTGDGMITARLAEVPTSDHPFIAGVFMRERMEPEAVEASMMMSASTSLRLNSRQGGYTIRQTEGPNVMAPWMRLVRVGDTFSGYSSTDGKAWSPAGTATVPMGATVEVGMACAATGDQELITAHFDHVVVNAQALGPAHGIGLVDGTQIPGDVTGFDGKTLKYTDAKKQPQTIPIAAVSCVFLRPLPPDEFVALATGKAGVSIVDGDFIEGQVMGAGDGKVTVTSLTFGPRDLQWSEVAALVLHPVTTFGAYAVVTRGSAIYRCDGVTTGDGSLTLNTALGAVVVKAGDVVEVVRK
jgi:hypothetical protein